ncbi:hypothetical protein JCM18750_39290 [Halostagnicola bangensis]
MEIHATGGIYFSERDADTEPVGILRGNTHAGSSNDDNLVSDKTPSIDDHVSQYPGQHYPLMGCSHGRQTESKSSQRLAVTQSP